MVQDISALPEPHELLSHLLRSEIIIRQQYGLLEARPHPLLIAESTKYPEIWLTKCSKGGIHSPEHVVTIVVKQNKTYIPASIGLDE